MIRGSVFGTLITAKTLHVHRVKVAADFSQVRRNLHPVDFRGLLERILRVGFVVTNKLVGIFKIHDHVAVRQAVRLHQKPQGRRPRPRNIGVVKLVVGRVGIVCNVSQPRTLWKV